MAETVIGAPLFRLFQDVVGLLDLLKALLRALVTRVDVRMQLAGKPPIGLFEIGFAGSPGNAEDLVRFLLFRGFPGLSPIRSNRPERWFFHGRFARAAEKVNGLTSGSPVLSVRGTTPPEPKSCH
jgi:hypothetical protein